MQNVAVVLVTYNRLNLLKEAIEALRSQTHFIFRIVVVDNGSTDGTSEWLGLQTDLYVIKQANSGGAGGFYTGVKFSASLNVDWVWLMDDDTICNSNSLEKLVEKVSTLPNEKIGFVGSKCVWSDGNPHYMNIVDIKPYFNNTVPFTKYDNYNLLLTEACSFVSVLINIAAIKKIGLPYKDFFIWGDDLEYTQRITKAGYLGFYCQDSIVVHKTPQNYRPNFYTESASNIWKYKYGLRNELFMIKRDKGLLYYTIWLFVKILYTSFKILVKRRDSKFVFIKAVFQSGFNSMFFNPKIERL